MKRMTLSLATLSFVAAGCGMSSNDSMSSAGSGPPTSGPSSSPAAPPSSPSTTETTAPGQGVQAGTLTAGSFDDHLNPEAFDSFLEGAAAEVEGAKRVAKRALIRVRTKAGEPVAQAEVVVAAGGRELVTLRTGTDGRALFLPARDGGSDAGPFELTVTMADGSKEVLGDQKLADAPWELALDAEASAAPDKLDVAFVVDATGSMGDELEYLKVESEDIAEQISQRYPGVDVRYALIVYRDEGDAYVTRSFDFSDLAEFRQHLTSQGANGGGDYPEAMDKALADAQQLGWREGNAARVLFLIGDAPPHQQQIGPTIDTFNALRRSGIRVYPVAASGVATTAEAVMRLGAFITLGRYLFLTDDSGVGNPHAEPHIPCYEVQKLRQLMVRMIASELAGELLAPKEADVIRTVGLPEDGVCQAPAQDPQQEEAL